MTTLMQKDVLLEYAHIGHLVCRMKQTQEIEDDLSAMGELWSEIMYTDEEDINYEEMLERIRAIRDKYEK